MKTHELKTWVGPFSDVLSGIKTFEYRKADRPYAAGDLLLLREYDEASSVYTGREALVEVTHLLNGGSFGIPSKYIILSIKLQDEVTKP